MLFSRMRAPDFVDHVDRLVRQAATGDVAVRQLDRLLEGIVGDLHAMMLFVPIAQALAESRPSASDDGGSTITIWNRRSRALSFSMYLRYSSSVVAPMHCSSPRLTGPA